MLGVRLASRFLLTIAIMFISGSLALADSATWTISKMSGDVWVLNGGVQKVSLGAETVVRPGEGLRTGRNGRVLLTRGQETILIAPNTVLSIPQGTKDGMSTLIMQQSGSATFDVEKRNVKHFQVETPMLATIVKGTQFTVSVTGKGTSVQVMRGVVEVSDFRTGQQVDVLPGQSVRVSLTGPRGLQLDGAGAKNPIRQGKPRAPGVDAVKLQKADAASKAPRISAPIGEVTLDFNKVTSGLARGSKGAAQNSGKDASSSETMWNSKEFKTQAGTETRGGGNSGSIAGGAGAVTAAGGTSSVGGAVSSAASSGGGNSGGLLSGVVSTATSTVNGVTSNGTVGGVLSGTTNTLGGLLGR